MDKEFIVITKEAFWKAVENVNLEFLHDEEISTNMKSVLTMSTFVIATKIEEQLFNR